MRVHARHSRGLAIAAACAGVAAVGAVSALSAGSAAAQAATGSITLYSGQHEQPVSRLAADFEKRRGVQVGVRPADEATLANQIRQGGSKSPADVFFAENPPA